jgi:dihydroorotate dehydrogenase (NAD+) catalytic subunit
VGFGFELEEDGLLSTVGALTTKSVTSAPRAGNPQPRLVDCPCGALNSIGLENPGIDAFAEDVLPRVARFPTERIVSVAASSPEELVELVERLSPEYGVDVIELNLSCPNVTGGRIGADAKEVARYVGRARVATSVPLLAKLPGDSGDFLHAARAALDAGADGLTLINSVRGLRIDRLSGRPFLHRAFGGLCGPAILPVALARVFEARDAFPDAVLVGTGGVTDLGSAVEMLLAGADLVGIGFGMMADPGIAVRLPEELDAWLDERGIRAVEEIIGAAHRGGFDVH